MAFAQKEVVPNYNKDFIVTSSLNENLMLIIALKKKKKKKQYHLGNQFLKGKDLQLVMTHNNPNNYLGKMDVVPRQHVFVGHFTAFSSFLGFRLGQEAHRVRYERNAGGTSTISESLSVEYFVRRFEAKDVVTEMEVEYCSRNWKKVDYICTLYGQRVGVSVTRAMFYPNPKGFSFDIAYRLLHKKLFGLIMARQGVKERHSFLQCILHVWCETIQIATIVEAAYIEVSRDLDITDDVIPVLTVAEGLHARPIFYEHCLFTSFNLHT
ncbi:unnamed protein product [Sphagnum jensenii]|uniref:Uncharacterized protein n=1 Tax=Sphagnum jensenii TaxID=128206 RepID=A0ABP1BYB9_9BRYO